jgi:FlaG/FlaF family flagellin (archaellin)
MQSKDNLMFKKRNECAVSEVMGSVLMVALVVILAAIIGSMVFGLVGNLQETKVIAVTAVRSNATAISITYNGGERTDQLNWLNITVNGAIRPSLGTFGSTTPLRVGNSTTVTGNTSGNDRVIVVGNFADGTQQVVLDTIL